jgi:hypothetical protein
VGSVIFWIVELAVIVLQFAGMWKAFEKAGQPGWAAIVPIYNLIVLCQIADKPPWWAIIMLCVPCVGLIFLLLVNIAIAEKFGQGAGMGVGLTLLGFIFWPILGFGSAQYEGGKRGRRRRRRDEDEDEDEDDRPRRRARDEDDEEEEEERPRRKPARARDEDDEDDDDRPRRKPRPRDDDDDDDEGERRVKRRPRDDD